MLRWLVASLVVFPVVLVAPALALETGDDAVIRHRLLKREFRQVERDLLRLAQRLEVSRTSEDREKAAVLRKVLDTASTEGVAAKFDKLLARLKAPVTLGDLAKMLDENKDLVTDLRTLGELLQVERLEETDATGEQRPSADVLSLLRQLHAIEAGLNKEYEDLRNLYQSVRKRPLNLFDDD